MEYVIFGSGGFAREVAEIVRFSGQGVYDPDTGTSLVRLLGFLDDNPAKHGTVVGDLPVLGGADWLESRPGTNVLLGVGSPGAKRSIVERIRPFSPVFPTLVDPSARVGSRVTMGDGVVICGNVIVTCDVTIKEFAAINLGATIAHDMWIGAYCTVAPACNLSGYTVLHEGVELGTNVSSIPGVQIGAWTTVGAGAVVTKDLPPGVVAVGIPAKPR